MTQQKKVNLLTWLNSKTDSELSSSSELPVQNKVVKEALDDLSDVATTTANGLMSKEDKSKLDNIEAEANKTIVDSALSASSENPVQNKVVKESIDEVISDVTDLQTALDGKADSNHTHTTAQVLDSSAYSNLDTAANSSQATINSAIDTKIGALLSIELITVVASLPTASADTMNKMYLVAESTSATNDKYEIFITVKEDASTYVWEKVDTARLDLSGYVERDDVSLEIVNDELILTV